MCEDLLTDEKEFSWSLSRERLFSFCPRAYFYHYYGSIGGFEQFSDAELLYQLKKIQSLDLWINTVCTEVLREFFYENPENFNIRKAAGRHFRQGARSVSRREWRDDPQRLNLFELYYGLVEIDALIEHGAKFLEKSIDRLLDSGLVDYLREIPYLDRKTFSFPVSTHLGRIKTWLAPVLVWLEDGLLKFLTLNKGHSDKSKAPYTAALHKFYAFNNLRIKPERVVTLNFDLTTGETTALSDDEINLSELIDYVKDSTAKMLALSSGRNTFSEDNFQKETNNCAKCKFRKYCKNSA